MPAVSAATLTRALVGAPQSGPIGYRLDMNDDAAELIATGSFSVDSWKDEPAADPDDDVVTGPSTRIGWVQLSKSFQGDLEGHSAVDMLAVSVAGEPAGYVAIERVSGTLAGRAGSFVLQHAATADGDAQALRIEVVPRTGSGELAGLRGDFEIIRHDDGSHAYSFAYRFEGLPRAVDSNEPG